MIINTNVAALNTFNALNKNTSTMNQALSELSSGKKINSAADDPSGLTISEQMQGQTNGLTQANANTQNGISLLQTAEGGLTETQSILQTMRSLAVQASNGTNTTEDLTAIKDQIQQYTAQIDNIANTTQFNTMNLLNGSIGLNVSNGAVVGSASDTSLTQTGTYAVDATAGTLATAATDTGATATDLATTSVGTKAGTLTINGVDVNYAAGSTYQDLANAINASVSGVTASFGTDGTGPLQIATNAVGANANLTITDANGVLGTGATLTQGTNASGVTVDLGGADATDGAISYNGNTVTVNGGVANGLQFNLLAAGKAADTSNITVGNSLSLQIGANQGQTMSISINAMGSSALGIGDLNLTSSTGAQNAISTLDTAISTVSAQNSTLGAYQDRLQYTSDNLAAASQNITSANSTLVNVDMASEMSQYTQASILVQAATSMLAQANQQPQTVLKLLQ
jgi:flagellin